MTKGDDFFKELLDNLYEGVYAVDLERRITYWNNGAERLTGFAAADVLGHRCMDNILMHVDDEGSSLCLTACPLSETMRTGTPGENNVYLHHRDGYRLPVAVRCSPIHDASGSIVGGVEVFRDDSPRLELEERVEELQRLALLDPLTGAGNRRYAEMEIGNRLAELRRHGWSFGLAFIDLDYFKEINDRYGHVVGDETLRMIARTAMNSLRTFDFLGRWGGEEFVAVITHADEIGLDIAAERTRVLIEQSSLTLPQGNLEVTVSVGATLAHTGDTLETLVHRADRLMYASKSAGRNRTTLG